MGCCKSKEPEEEISRKIAVVGNDKVGKTCLIQRYIKNEFDEDTPSAYIPSSLQVDESVEQLKNGKKVHLYIYDLGGRDTFKHLRKLNYPKSDAAIICFSIDDKSSLEAVKDWAQDMHRICPGIPIILAGLKKDARDEARTIKDFVRESNGHSMAKKHNLVRYIECSSMTGEGVREVFATIALEAAKRQTTRKELINTSWESEWLSGQAIGLLLWSFWETRQSLVGIFSLAYGIISGKPLPSGLYSR